MANGNEAANAQPVPTPKKVVVKEGRPHMSQTLAKKKKKMGLSKAEMAKREAFIKKLAATRKMWGLGAPGGDMIGCPYEYIGNNVFHTNFDLWSVYSVTTDDGKLALTLGEFLAKNDALSLPMAEATRLLMNQYYDAVQRYPDVNGAWGPVFKRDALAAAKKPKNLPTYSSFANGGAMRVGAVISAARTLEEVYLLSELSALPSHSAPQGIQGATVIAVVGWMAKQHKYEKSEILAYCKEHFPDFNWDTTIDEHREHHQTYLDNGYVDACPFKAVQTVPIAVRAFLEGDGSYESVVKLAISAGGDSDTIGAMAGAIAEAAYGIPDDIKEHIMDGLDVHELTQAITFDAYAARRQAELEWNEKYKDDVVCGQKPRATYEKILKEMISGDALKNAFGEELPEALQFLKSNVIDAINAPDSHPEAYKNLSVLSGSAAEALEKLYEDMNAKMIREFDADAVEKVTLLNKMIAAVKGLSIAPVAPERDRNQEEAYNALSERAKSLSMDMLEMRMAARIPPKDKSVDPARYVVIEPEKNKAYELARRAEKALQKMQKAVSDDYFKKQNGAALAELQNGEDFAALFLYENIRHYKSVAALDPDAEANMDRRAEIREAKDYMRAFDSQNVDTWIREIKNDGKFSEFVKSLDAEKLKGFIAEPDGMQKAYRSFTELDRNRIDSKESEIARNADKKPTADAVLAGESALKVSAIKKLVDNEATFDATVSAEARAWNDAIERQRLDSERMLEKETAFGKKTTRYYQAVVKNMMADLNELFPADLPSEVITLSESDVKKEYDLKKLLSSARDDLKLVADKMTGGSKLVFAATDSLDTLDLIYNCLQEKLSRELDDPKYETNPELMKNQEQLMKQITLIGRLTAAVDDVNAAPADPVFDINDTLYHKLDDRIHAINEKMGEFEAKPTEEPKVYELAKLAKQSLINMQKAVEKDCSRGNGDNKTLEGLKKGNDYATVFLYQQVQNLISVSKQVPGENDDPAKKAKIETAAANAKATLNTILGHDLKAALKSVKKDPTYKEFEQNLSVNGLDKAMNSAGAMLQEYNTLKQRKLANAAHVNADAAVNTRANAKSGKDRTFS